MTIEVFGSFESKEEAIKEVDGLSLKGIPADHITIFTLKTNAEKLAKETDGKVVNVEEDTEDELSKVKKVLLKISDSDKSFHDELLNAGLSEEQATRYAEEIRSGNFLVIADNKLKMGHHSTIGDDELEVPYKNRLNH